MKCHRLEKWCQFLKAAYVSTFRLPFMLSKRSPATTISQQQTIKGPAASITEAYYESFGCISRAQSLYTSIIQPHTEAHIYITASVWPKIQGTCSDFLMNSSQGVEAVRWRVGSGVSASIIPWNAGIECVAGESLNQTATLPWTNEKCRAQRKLQVLPLLRWILGCCLTAWLLMLPQRHKMTSNSINAIQWESS